MKKNRFLSVLLAIGVLAGGCSVSNNSLKEDVDTSLKAGSYKSVVEGISGDIKISTEVDESKIVKIDVAETETPNLGGAAIKQLSEDIVAGATISSNAILKGVEETEMREIRKKIQTVFFQWILNAWI